MSDDDRTFTTKTAIASLRSKVCPACGKAKKARQSLCYPCYKRLPRERQSDLYKGVGEGYEQALDWALTLLGTTVPYMADPEPRP